MGNLSSEQNRANDDVVVLGLDPGTDKCGVAVVSPQRGVLHQQIVAVAELQEVVAKLAAKFALQKVAVGDRTGSAAVRRRLSQAGIRLPVEQVSEDMTSRLARQRYWQQNPPRGLARLIPLGLRVPPRPVDDYAAVIIAERLLEKEAQQR